MNGLPGEEFGAKHEVLLSRLRHLLVPARLEEHAAGLLKTAAPALRGWADRGRVELWEASKHLVFQSAGRQLFGAAFFERWGEEHLQRTFFVFEVGGGKHTQNPWQVDQQSSGAPTGLTFSHTSPTRRAPNPPQQENFEIAASPIPHLLLPAFRRARKDLLRMFRASLAAGDFRGTAVEELLAGCGLREKLHPNVLLAVLWASQVGGCLWRRFDRGLVVGIHPASCRCLHFVGALEA